MKRYDDSRSLCCGTCRYHKRDKQTGDWICINDESEYFGLETDYEDDCVDWGGKDNE